MNSSTSAQTRSENEDGLNQEWLLMRGAQELRDSDLLIDVILIVDGVKLPGCHKFVLAASSPYFRAMFSHGMIEQNKKEIDIMGVDVESLRLVLDYLYTTRIPIGDDNVQGLMTTCSLLQIPGLYGKCRDYMIRRLDLSNCISVYKFAKSLYCTKLEVEAFRIIARRFCEISETEDFLTLDKDEFITIISSDDIWVTEEETIYEVVILWLSFEPLDRACHIAEVFSYVRFALMKEKYLDCCILEEEMIQTFPQLRAQVEAAKQYLGAAKILLPEAADKEISPSETQENLENSPDVVEKSNDTKSTETSNGSNFLSYYVTMSGIDHAVRIPLTITPRAGMNTKEYLLFTNGRKTFVVNPASASEYYGCVDGKAPTHDSRDDGTFLKAGWSPSLPLMKNPEAFTSTEGTVYLFGGLEVEKIPETNIRTKVYSLQPDTLEWTTCAALPNPRCMAAYGDGCGNIYVLGGKALSHGDVISRVQKYDKVENQWDDVAPMPVAVYGHGCASLKDKIYVMGGKTASKELLSDLYSMECENHQWTNLKSLSIPRFLHGVTVNAESGEIFVVGGSSEDGVLSCVEVYNTRNDRWRYGESFPGNRCAQFAMYIKNELHAVGGYVTERNTNGRYESREMHDVFQLDSASNQWKRTMRRIKGTTGSSLACVKVRLNVSKICRASNLTD